MRKLLIACLPAALCTAGCATNEPGWTGSGAQPFDQSLADCQAEVRGIAGEAQRDSAFEQCMARKGWMR